MERFTKHREDQMSNRDKFIALAERRVNKALAQIQSVGKLSNRSRYEYSDEDVDKIISALKDEVNNIEEGFRKGDRKTSSFSL
jgi:hypothetical protein